MIRHQHTGGNEQPHGFGESATVQLWPPEGYREASDAASVHAEVCQCCRWRQRPSYVESCSMLVRSLRNQRLIGSQFTKRKYQHLSYVVNILVPVRYPSDGNSKIPTNPTRHHHKHRWSKSRSSMSDPASIYIFESVNKKKSSGRPSTVESNEGIARPY
jgi:hypothetical protein